jgi:hypothetical protein
MSKEGIPGRKEKKGRQNKKTRRGGKASIWSKQENNKII